MTPKKIPSNVRSILALHSLLAEVREHPGCCEAGSHKRQYQTETVPQDLVLALLHSCFEGICLPARVEEKPSAVGPAFVMLSGLIYLTPYCALSAWVLTPERAG